MRLVADAKERLDRFLARRMPEHSRTKLARIIAEGGITVDGEIEKPSFLLEPGMEVELEEPADAAPHDLAPADIPLDVVYEDDDLLVVDKPRGLASHPAASLKEPSLVNALLGRGQALSSGSAAYRPGIVHRLDKETTGLILVAKTDFAHAALAGQIASKTAERRYVAIVVGEPEHERFTVRAPLGRNKRNRMLMAVDPNGKPAVTHVRKIARLENGWLVAIRLETGRTHQIRVHLQAVGHPVLGDALYAPKPFADGPLQLHAAYLAFTHPRTGRRIQLYAPPPEDFEGAKLVTAEALDF